MKTIGQNLAAKIADCPAGARQVQSILGLGWVVIQYRTDEAPDIGASIRKHTSTKNTLMHIASYKYPVKDTRTVRRWAAKFIDMTEGIASKR